MKTLWRNYSSLKRFCAELIWFLDFTLPRFFCKMNLEIPPFWETHLCKCNIIRWDVNFLQQLAFDEVQTDHEHANAISCSFMKAAASTLEEIKPFLDTSCHAGWQINNLIINVGFNDIKSILIWTPIDQTTKYVILGQRAASISIRSSFKKTFPFAHISSSSSHNLLMISFQNIIKLLNFQSTRIQSELIKWVCFCKLQPDENLQESRENQTQRSVSFIDLWTLKFMHFFLPKIVWQRKRKQMKIFNIHIAQ